MSDPLPNKSTPDGVAADIALLFSGGLDSAILLGELLKDGCRVQPLFIRSGLMWEDCELSAASAFIGALKSPAVAGLRILEVPVRDTYEQHWSLTGVGV